MTEHLSDVDLRAFHARRLEPDVLLRMDDHLASCDPCRRRLADLGPGMRFDDILARLAGPAAHLSDDDLTGFASDALDDRAKRQVAEHVERCEDCARQVSELAAWRTSAPRARPVWIALAAAVLAVAVMTPFLVRLVRSRQPARAAASSLMNDPVVIASIQAGEASVPTFMNELNGSPEVLLGPTPGQTGFVVHGPRATAVLSDTPEFSWEAVRGARTYVVSIYDMAGDLVRRSPALTASEWRDGTSLRRGVTYVWQVDAAVGERTLTAPAPPAPPARFHVVDAATVDRLTAAQRGHADEHLALGLLYMNAGVVDRARAELRQVPASDLHADVAARSLAQLDRIKP